MKVTLIPTHRNSHLDEVAGRWLMVQSGKFEGAASAPIQFVDDDLIGDEAAMLAKGIVSLGVGRSLDGKRFRFNDHDPKEPYGRVPNHCCATLVADDCGLLNDPDLRRLLPEVLKCDTERHGFRTNLAAMIKSANRAINGLKMPAPSMTVFNFATWALDAIVQQEHYAFAPVEGELTATDFLRKINGALRGADPKTHGRIMEYLRDLVAKSDQRIKNGDLANAPFVTDIAFIVRAFQRWTKDGKPHYDHNWIKGWMEFFLLAMYKEQQEFWTVVQEIETIGRKHHKTGKVVCDVEWPSDLGRRVTCFVYEGDSIQAANAIRHVFHKRVPDVIIVLGKAKKTGAIFFSSRLDGTSTAKMLNYLELQSAKPKKWSAMKVNLDRGGWHLGPGFILAGSESHENETKLSKADIIDATGSSFDSSLRKIWCKHHRVQYDAPDELERIENRRVTTAAVEELLP